MTVTRIDEDGKLQADIAVDVKEAGLKAGKGQDVRAVLYKPNGSDEPTPLTTPDGKHAIAVPLTVWPRKGQDVFRLQFGIRLTEHAGEDVLVIVERVPSRWVPVAIVASLVALALAAAWLLGAWGDPSARRVTTRERRQRRYKPTSTRTSPGTPWRYQLRAGLPSPRGRRASRPA